MNKCLHFCILYFHPWHALRRLGASPAVNNGAYYILRIGLWISQFWADYHPTIQRNCSTAHIGPRLATQEQTCARYIFRFANATQGNVPDHRRLPLTQGSSHHLTTKGATCQSVGPRGKFSQSLSDTGGGLTRWAHDHCHSRDVPLSQIIGQRATQVVQASLRRGVCKCFHGGHPKSVDRADINDSRRITFAGALFEKTV